MPIKTVRIPVKAAKKVDAPVPAEAKADAPLPSTVDTSVFAEVDGAAPAEDIGAVAAAAEGDVDAALGPVAHHEEAEAMTEEGETVPDKPVVIPTGGLPVMGRAPAAAPAPATADPAAKAADPEKPASPAPVQAVASPAPAEVVAEAPTQYEQEATIQVTKGFYRTAEGKLTLVKEEAGPMETLFIRQFVTAPAKSGRHIARTINLGDYNSMKIGVWSEIPHYTEEMDDAVAYVEQETNDRMDHELEVTDAALNGTEAPATAAAPAATAPAVSGVAAIAKPTNVVAAAPLARTGGLPVMGKK